MPEFVCSNCHEPPEDHLPGECDACHTQASFAESASFLVDLAPEIARVGGSGGLNDVPRPGGSDRTGAREPRGLYERAVHPVPQGRGADTPLD